MKKIRLFIIVFITISLAFSTKFVYADPSLPLPRMPICGDQDDPTDPIVLHCSDLVPYTDVQIYKVPDEEDINLVFDFVYREATYNNELGLFKVENSDGTINGINPGEPGYLSAALSNATIIFASGSNAYTPDKVIQFDKNEYIAFFIIRNGTLSNFLLNNPDNNISTLPLAFFSLDILNPDGVDHFVGFQSTSGINTQFGFEDMTYGGDKDYDDVVYNIIPPIQPACDEWLGEYFDNRDLSGNPVLTRCDKKIDFNWTDKSSPDIKLIPIDDFSVSWKRTINITDAGLYRFRAFTDDGLRLYIDGKLQIDDWNEQWFEENSIKLHLDDGLHSIQMDYAEWSGDALAYLNYYYCPEGEKDCGLDIVPQYQTKYLNNPMPAGCTNVTGNDGNQTIATYGCLITSISMALQANGINTNPDELNNWLSEEEHYGYDGGSCDGFLKTKDLVWPIILQFAQDKYNKDLKWQTTNDANTPIEEDKPVIMNVDSSGHWILAVNSIRVDSQDSLGINDPHHAFSCLTVAADPTSLIPSSNLVCYNGSLKHATTTIEEANYRGLSSPRAYLIEDSTPRTASMQLTIVGTEVMLIDSNLRHIGFNRITSEIVNQFPNGMYYNSEIVPPGYDSAGIIMRTLYLPEDAYGNYVLQLIDNTISNFDGKSEGTEFHINIRGYDEDFNLVEADLSGDFSNNDNLEYYIRYIPGQTLEIIPMVHTFIPAIYK